MSSIDKQCSGSGVKEEAFVMSIRREYIDTKCMTLFHKDGFCSLSGKAQVRA